ncbi:MAG TPA: hypothetical protein VJN95_00815 [Gemmatimonadales bacterium]|nr:hypothetical protein [Gemmatimonadales bacterium]
MIQPRRTFLGLMGLGSLASLVRPLSASEPLAHSVHPEPVDDTWDMSWVDKVSGKYKAVFDSPEVSEGAALFRACVWRDNYKTVYGTDPGEMSAVVVFRHEAIALAMNDEYWDRYDQGKENKLKDEATGKWTRVNPIRVAPPGTPEKWASYNLTSFMASGGVVLACRMAFADVVSNVMKKEKLAKDAAIEKAKALLVPGIILQPSGVFGVLRAQEAGCAYIKAS